MKSFNIAVTAFMFLKGSILIAYAYLLKFYAEFFTVYGVPIYVLALALLTIAFSLAVRRNMHVERKLIQCILFYLMIVFIPIVIGKLYWNLLYMKFTYFGWLTDVKGFAIFIVLESIIMVSVFAVVKPIKING